ncbi:unnamed protein product, partial [Chondrus crispus]
MNYTFRQQQLRVFAPYHRAFQCPDAKWKDSLLYGPLHELRHGFCSEQNTHSYKPVPTAAVGCTSIRSSYTHLTRFFIDPVMDFGRAFNFCFFAVFIALTSAAKKNNGGFDHRAHAVPGGPYQGAAGGDGKAVIRLNGELSHSHYFNAFTGATGRIVNYRWTAGGKKICGSRSCSVKFSLGKTTIKLRVIDNSGDSAIATTFVYVVKGSKPGVRVWYYPGNGWAPNRPTAGVKASQSTTKSIINLASKASFPAFLVPQRFSMRLLGNVNFFKRGNYRFRIGCGGAACSLWVGNKMILTGSNRAIDSRPIMFSKGVRSFALVFRRQNPKGPKPKLTLSWRIPGSGGWNLIPAKHLSHSPSSYAPVVNRISPKNPSVGNVITIHGTSLLNVKSVKIGSQFCAGPVSKSQFVLRCVMPGVSGKQKLRVTTKSGKSNAIRFNVGRGNFASGKGGVEGGGKGPMGYYQPISFSSTFLQRKGKAFRASQLTAIALGPDGKYYIGSLNGVVHVLTTNFGNVITNYCKSSRVGKMRSILGVAFNPADTKRVRLYASTSILYWGVKKVLPLTKGWHNGQIVAMQKTKKSCLARVATVISGLPVSNHDHSVNGVTFDHYGNLLVTVGGGTNAGVGGDVWVYGAGLRNSFCSVAHSNGHIYATDNGANAKFGARSTSCKGSGPVSTEPDTLKKVRRGGFHGYANRNRGRFDRRQCVHRPPQKKMRGYDRHIATLQSSTDGLIEYTANTFGAQMRGDLLATKFAVSGAGQVFRVRLNRRGTVRSVFELTKHSGLTAAMSPTGGMVMPRVYQGKVAVLLPNEKNPGRLVVTSVNPFRGPKRGGNVITVTGWNLRAPLKATVGGKPCRGVGNFKKGRSFTCVAPPGKGRAAVVVKRF